MAQGRSFPPIETEFCLKTTVTLPLKPLSSNNHEYRAMHLVDSTTEERPFVTPVEAARTALAVIGEGDATSLSALLDGLAPPVDATVLRGLPDVGASDGGWAISPGVAVGLVNELAEQRPASFLLLHERALTHWAIRLRAQDASGEAHFLAILDRLATYLAGHDPQHLATLLAHIDDVPLTTPAGRQLRSYFQALARLRADQYDEALAHFEALLADPTLDRGVRGRVLNSRAYLHNLRGQVEEAMTGLRAGLRLWRELGDALNEGKALLNLGIMAYELQQYDEAETHLRDAERAFMDAGSAQMVAAAHNELGLLCRDLGRWADALRYLEASAQQARAAGSADALGIALLNMGEVLLLQGELARAEPLLHEALAQMQTLVHKVDVHVALGLLRQARGELADARSAFEAALAAGEALGRRDLLAELHFRLGEALRLQGEDGAALAQYQLAASVVEEARTPIGDEGLKISLLGRWQQIYERLVLHVLRLGQPEAAWAWAERARARAFAEQIQSSRAGGAAGDEIGDVATLAEVQAALPPDGLLVSYFTTGVFDHHAPFWRALAQTNPLRSHLLTPAQTVRFAIHRNGLAAHLCPVDPNAFASASQRHEDRSRFLTPRTLQSLWRILLGGLEVASPGRLYMAPHGPLHHVPFAALLDPGGQPLLRADRPCLLYTPGGAILSHLRQPRQEHPRRPCLAVGYAGVASGHVLRHTETEARLVAALTGGAAQTGPVTDVAALREAARDCRWLHIACHGWFDYEHPLASYLALGPGLRLTADEVLRNWRLRAELVTLSACQTGMHRLLRGDEPMGLIRAFLVAGARAVVATQWAVEDLPTLFLMGHFYAQLAATPGADPATALRDAQCWLREATAAELARSGAGLDGMAAPPGQPSARPFSDPRHWAGFVIFGG